MPRCSITQDGNELVLQFPYDAAMVAELKAGYRRMVFQWHPDRCREANAQDQFMAIQHAYEVLSTRRDRYDAGLAFEMSLRSNSGNANVVVGPENGGGQAFLQQLAKASGGHGVTSAQVKELASDIKTLLLA